MDSSESHSVQNGENVQGVVTLATMGPTSDVSNG